MRNGGKSPAVASIERVAIPARDIGTEMSARGIAEVSAQIDIAAVLAYRRAVGQRTRQVVQQVTADELQQRVEPERIERVKAEGALVSATYPPTVRHSLTLKIEV